MDSMPGAEFRTALSKGLDGDVFIGFLSDRGKFLIDLATLLEDNIL
jgi:hypothetical protein